MRSSHKLGQLSTEQVLRAEGLVDAQQAEEIVEEHRATSERITDIALARGLVTEYDLAKAMCRQLQLPYILPTQYDTPDEIGKPLAGTFFHGHRLVPMDRFGSTLIIATCGDLDMSAIEHIESETKGRVGIYIALVSEIERVLKEKYPVEDLGTAVASRLDELFGG